MFSIFNLVIKVPTHIIIGSCTVIVIVICKWGKQKLPSQNINSKTNNSVPSTLDSVDLKSKFDAPGFYVFGKRDI